MLPQEVKEMGEDTEIVFYENLRPVRAKKIRYFEDRLLKSRILPPPEVAMILDPSRPPPKRPLPPEPESDSRTVERIPARPKPRPGPIRPRQKLRQGSLADRNPPTDPVVIESAVSAYLAKLVENDSSPGGNPPSS